MPDVPEDRVSDQSCTLWKRGGVVPGSWLPIGGFGATGFKPDPNSRWPGRSVVPLRASNMQKRSTQRADRVKNFMDMEASQKLILVRYGLLRLVSEVNAGFPSSG
jgi:hypothetical protein